MIENDTICLLRECDAGIKMGITSIEDVIDSTRAPEGCWQIPEKSIKICKAIWKNCWTNTTTTAKNRR